MLNLSCKSVTWSASFGGLVKALLDLCSFLWYNWIGCCWHTHDRLFHCTCLPSSCCCRHREKWLLLIAPSMALITLLMSLSALSQGRPALLLPNRAYRAYWASRGELQTGMLRPFLQHMRLRPYLVYTLIDAALTAWVFAQVFGVWAAVARMVAAAGMSVGICWGFDLHMRRRFAAAMARRQQRQLLQQQQQLQ